ncbi:MAG: hypothetical protein H6694_05910 [Candidatus Latescibacteria bacterium]|nr:hypothetical protein [Candidatus Latescibacterota bacterium]
MPTRPRHRRLALLALASALWVGSSAAAELFPLDALRPGMRGEGFSVFQGDSITRFEVEIVDRVSGRAPYDLVLVRCLGEQLERDGISQGMSGSPVYIDGRWLGAIAFNFNFAKEPLGLVTPASAMLALADRPAGTAGGRADAGDLRALPYLGADWSPATPPALATATGEPLTLSVAGLSPASLAALASRYGAGGLTLQPMGTVDAAGSGAAPAAPLAPGAALAVELLRGPVSAAAIGTVSHVDGDRIWAFGHPFLGEGPVTLPLASARIHAVLPSLYNSFKLGAMGESVGTLLLDGQSGIYGRLGEAPPLLPLRVTLRTADGEAPLSANFGLARHRRLQATLGRLALDGWLPGRLGSAQRGCLAMDVTLSARDDANAPVRVRVGERFAGQGSVGAVGAWLQSLLAALGDNPAGPLPLDSLDVALDWTAGQEPLLLQDLSLTRAALRPGEPWRLRLNLRQGDGDATDRVLDFPDPAAGPVERLAGAALPPGDYRLHVADGTTFERWNVKRQPALYDLDDHAALLDLLGRLESTAHWVVWLEAPGEDAVAGGREFAMPVRFRELAPTSRREELLTPKEPRRIVALQRLDVPPGAAAQGHLSLPVTVLDTPRRSEP